MLLLRWLVLASLLGSAVCFALYAVTGQQRFKRNGLRVLKWTLTVAFIFFGVLILERIA